MRNYLIAMLLAADTFASGDSIVGQTIKLDDEGVLKGRVNELNCVGAGIACTVTNRKGTITVTATGGGGTVTADSPLTGDGSSGSHLAIPAAGSGVAGYLTAADWATFNGKAPATSGSAILKGNGSGGFSSAASGTDYVAPTSGAALLLGSSGNTANYAGTSCSNQFPRSLSTAGAATCASVALATDVSGTLAAAQFPALTGDVTTVAGALASTLASVGSAGSCGGATSSCAVTFDAKGRETARADTAIALPAGAITSGTLAQGVGGTGAGALTCSAGQHITSNGTAYSCSADTGSGTPGGSTTQVQYNNAGAFAGITNLTTDGTNPILTKVAAEPSAPATGKLTPYLRSMVAASSPGLLKVMDGDLGFGIGATFPFFGANAPSWGCWQTAWGYSGELTSGAMRPPTVVLTSNAGTWASTSLLTRTPRIQYPTAATANLNAGVYSPGAQVWRGNSVGQGGFLVFGSAAIITTNSTQRVMWGLKNSISAPTAGSDPNVLLDTVYVGANAADTNLSICSNDNTSTATCTTLGASFPAKTANAFYNFAFWAAPNATTIGYAIERLDLIASTSGTIATDLPRNTVQMQWNMTVNSGANATATTEEVPGVCWVANP